MRSVKRDEKNINFLDDSFLSTHKPMNNDQDRSECVDGQNE